MPITFIFPIWIHGWVMVAVIAIGLWSVIRLRSWWKIAGSFHDLFGDPNRSEATRRIGIPAAFILFICITLLVIPSRPKSIYDSDLPVLTHFYVANYSDQSGKMFIGEQEEYFDAHEARAVEVHCGPTSDHVQAWLGGELVIDTKIAQGYYIANFSDDINVIAEEVIYGGYYGHEEPNMEMLSGPGVKQFTTQEQFLTILGFKEQPPEKIEVYDMGMGQVGSDRRWSIKTYTDSELLERVLGGSRE